MNKPLQQAFTNHLISGLSPMFQDVPRALGDPVLVDPVELQNLGQAVARDPCELGQRSQPGWSTGWWDRQSWTHLGDPNQRIQPSIVHLPWSLQIESTQRDGRCIPEYSWNYELWHWNDTVDVLGASWIVHTSCIYTNIYKRLQENVQTPVRMHVSYTLEGVFCDQNVWTSLEHAPNFKHPQLTVRSAASKATSACGITCVQKIWSWAPSKNQTPGQGRRTNYCSKFQQSKACLPLPFNTHIHSQQNSCPFERRQINSLYFKMGHVLWYVIVWPFPAEPSAFSIHFAHAMSTAFRRPAAQAATGQTGLVTWSHSEHEDGGHQNCQNMSKLSKHILNISKWFMIQAWVCFHLKPSFQKLYSKIPFKHDTNQPFHGQKHQWWLWPSAIPGACTMNHTSI